jgi:sRNA-binding protein
MSNQLTVKQRRAKAWLWQAFPVLWDDKTWRPMVIGAGPAILAQVPRAISKTTVRQLLAGRVRSDRYLLAMIRPGAMRFSLDGVEVEAVTEEHAAAARATLKGRRAARRKRSSPSALLLPALVP